MYRVNMARLVFSLYNEDTEKERTCLPVISSAGDGRAREGPELYFRDLHSQRVRPKRGLWSARWRCGETAVFMEKWACPVGSARALQMGKTSAGLHSCWGLRTLWGWEVSGP